MRKIILLTVLLALTSQGDDFAFKLYDQLRSTEGNLFFSPASIESALAMVREGAVSNTLRQISLLLPEQTIFPAIGTNVTLESANGIWVDQKFPIHEKYKTVVQEKYGAEIRPADFSGQPDAERETVNRWVEGKTRDKIKDLLGPGSVTTDTRLILVNAIYFKGDWLHAFEKAKTTNEPFWILPETSTNVPMMTMKPERFGYLENESFQCLELPYQGEEVSMLIILPKEKDGLTRVEEGLSTGAVADWIGALRSKEVEVHLPKFKVETSLGSLRETLSALGITDAFDPERADFSGISAEPLFISDAVHKAFVQVDEEGTEAAAATGMIMNTTSITPPPKVFRANRPFIFLIRAKESGDILFIGKVCNPAK
jgi:serpin B